MRSSSFPRPTAGFGFAETKTAGRVLQCLRQKRRGPRLGWGPLKARFSCWRRFHTSAWGHPSLASLSEAGGNDLQKVTSKPLPPRLSLPTFRHLKRAHAAFLCKASANVAHQGPPHKYLLMFKLASPYVHPQTPNLHWRFNSEPTPR
jgi:hypothetical protein